MELNIRQRKAVEASESHILCLASAAAGKTRVLTERIRHLIEVKGVSAKDIVAITFTNMSADEIKRRIGDSCTGAYIGTLHGYANKLCLANGVNTALLIANYEFDEIIRKAMQISRLKYPFVKHILVDECQDLSALEYAFLERIPAANRYYTGDARQAIYGFKGGTDEYLEGMYHDLKYTKYYLTQNYRNTPDIIKYADSFLYSSEQFGPPAEAVKTNNGLIEDCTFMEALEELEWSENWGSWFILTRTNNELVTAQEICNEKEIPNVTFKKGDLELAELDSLMSSNKVKILTVHTSKGLENKNVIVTGCRTYNEEERKICYVAATRAEHSLYWCPAIAKRGYKKHPVNKKAEAGRIFKNMDDVITF